AERSYSEVGHTGRDVDEPERARRVRDRLQGSTADACRRQGHDRIRDRIAPSVVYDYAGEREGPGGSRTDDAKAGRVVHLFARPELRRITGGSDRAEVAG